VNVKWWFDLFVVVAIFATSIVVSAWAIYKIARYEEETLRRWWQVASAHTHQLLLKGGKLGAYIMRAWKIDGTSRTAFLYRKVKRNVVATVLDWYDYWSKPALLAKSRQAERRLHLCNENVDDAQVQVVVQKLNRARSARKSAAVLVKMLIAAEAAQKRAERKRTQEMRNLQMQHKRVHDREEDEQNSALRAIELLAEHACDEPTAIASLDLTEEDL